jgi:ParB-like chromosome segregation protein Spo0J
MAGILDLTNRNVPQPHIAGSKNNELGRPHRDSDAWFHNNSYHYAETTIDNIIVPDNRLWEPDEKHIDELAASIETDGLLVPIGVKWRNGERKTSNDYRTPVVDLIYGFHRLAAMKKLHAKYGGEKYFLVQTLVYSPALNKQQIARIESIENLMRRTPTATEKAKFTTVLTKYKAHRLLAVLELARAPIVTETRGPDGSYITAPVTTIAAEAGVDADTLKRDTDRVAKVLGVENFSRSNPEKMAELAAKTAEKIADIETDDTGAIGEQFAASVKKARKAEQQGKAKLEIVKTAAALEGRDDIVADILDAETTSERNTIVVEAAKELNIPLNSLTFQTHWPADRVVSALMQGYKLERCKEISRKLIAAIRAEEG